MREKIKKSISFFKDNLWPIAVLAVFLSLASWGFLGQGVVNFDEAYFSIVVRTFSEIARAAIFHPFSFFSGDFLSRLSDDYGNVYTAARPSYILASSFLALLMPAATALRVTSLLSALLLLIYFYRILPFYGLTGKRTRSLLTLLPAMSPLLLVYSRLGLSQIFSAAFLTVSFYYLLRLSRSGHRRDLIGFSLSLGVLFMSHYNVMFTVFFLAALAAFILVRSRARFSFWLTGIASFLSLPLLWEAVTQIASLLAGDRFGGGQRVLAYSGEFLSQLGKTQASGESYFSQPYYYFDLLLSSEGLFVLGLLIVGFLMFLRKFKFFEYQACLITLVLTFLLFLATPLKFPRNIVCVLPLVYLLVVFAVWRLAGFLSGGNVKRASFLAIMICVLSVSPHLFVYGKYLNVDAGNEEAAKYIRANYRPEEVVIVSWSAPIWRVYLPGYRSEQLAQPDSWKPLLKQRPKLLLIDDCFSAILDSGETYGLRREREVFGRETRIFTAKPIILDFVYKDPVTIDRIFSENQVSRIAVHEASW